MTGSMVREGKDKRKSLHLKTTQEAGREKKKFQKIFTSSVKTAVHHPKAGTSRKYLHANWAESLLASPWH